MIKKYLFCLYMTIDKLYIVLYYYYINKGASYKSY